MDSACYFSEYWESMYDKTQNSSLKEEMNKFGGRDMRAVYRNSLYGSFSEYNRLNKKFDMPELIATF